MNDIVIREQWYQQLVDDCKDILIEEGTAIRWGYIRMWHTIGTRILSDENNFTRGGYTIDGLTKRVSASLGLKNERTVQLAIQGARKYPDLDMVPLGKNSGWRDFVKLLQSPTGKLPEPKEEFVNCPHCGTETQIIICRWCGHEFELKGKMIRRR